MLKFTKWALWPPRDQQENLLSVACNGSCKPAVLGIKVDSKGKWSELMWCFPFPSPGGNKKGIFWNGKGEECKRKWLFYTLGCVPNAQGVQDTHTKSSQGRIFSRRKKLVEKNVDFYGHGSNVLYGLLHIFVVLIIIVALKHEKDGIFMRCANIFTPW